MTPFPTPFRTALLVSVAALGGAWFLARCLAPGTGGPPLPAPDLAQQVAAGKRFYAQSCLHCHGTEADGEGEDGGADLRGLRLSHARIAGVIRNGIKGEMPPFRKKYGTAEIDALVAYLRTLPAQ
ncbi:Cytochrome C oxidase, cbb3-type, subunit III [Verrucomicrobium sp. GAS474]|uniref:c-type cytochrome n=1 Tax=Verrucomicrobium sp. GAS474 TaxID=1882831 RepID=UPI00087D0401|nr:cytochrome c [Verrucomicrobium sp. GAS474]SDT91141.1 Cytochrome C oxidase, cbb3-type, subunit III [Verrucomicrobium sp. GAS474]